ncbi:hypothetical protein G6O69_24440 [Pseudenhygromyxa sp. WMMC2535]|uniref:hypothetical protein n=1 Tax=Pseudenhygromyxa sp. WMMC2535 TaxID=2712867 RepID=UPI0015524634|nr:hypothetical protein [Pseudenhygromyxa sp. WMMC2535]NVB41012.1 hypothetical protein [Pseudenhygromyxa sp. WMMC2535]
MAPLTRLTSPCLLALLVASVACHRQDTAPAQAAPPETAAEPAGAQTGDPTQTEDVWVESEGEGVLATKEDCVRLGEIFAVLFIEEAERDEYPLAHEILVDAAAVGKEELIQACQANPPPKAAMECAFSARSMVELERC